MRHLIKEKMSNLNERPDNAEIAVELKLRPSSIDHFIGQSRLKSNLKVFIAAAKMRDESLDHVLLYGPPGLGKTTLSNIIAKELGSGIHVTSGPIITKTGDLAALLTNLKNKDVLFIDEIHRLPKAVEEMLYSAMEDFRLDIIIGEGPAARAIKIDLQRFTLVGATTRVGLISRPLLGRFSILMPLQFYNQEELTAIVLRCVRMQNMTIEQKTAQMIAKRARGTPRIAIRIARRTMDFAVFEGSNSITDSIVQTAMDKIGIDDYGLDDVDIKYLNFIRKSYNNGPVGISTISAGLAEDQDSIEETIEPFLLQEGFIEKTPRGRVLTGKAISHLSGIKNLL
jgi:holliday junction DNA helicase RuvB